MICETFTEMNEVLETLNEGFKMNQADDLQSFYVKLARKASKRIDEHVFTCQKCRDIAWIAATMATPEEKRTADQRAQLAWFLNPRRNMAQRPDGAKVSA